MGALHPEGRSSDLELPHSYVRLNAKLGAMAKSTFMWCLLPHDTNEAPIRLEIRSMLKFKEIVLERGIVGNGAGKYHIPPLTDPDLLVFSFKLEI